MGSTPTASTIFFFLSLRLHTSPQFQIDPYILSAFVAAPLGAWSASRLVKYLFKRPSRTAVNEHALSGPHSRPFFGVNGQKRASRAEENLVLGDFQILAISR